MHRNFRNKARIVLIDDNYEHLMGVKELLNLEGCYDVVQTSTSVSTGVNMVKKHIKANGQDQTGGIVDKEAAIHVSNVALVKDGKATKIGYKVVDGKKVRVARKTGEVID